MDRAEGSRVNGDSFGGVKGKSTDLVYEFMKQSPDNGGREDMGLYLGLSTNGRFGVDPTREKLRRSTSLSNVVVTHNSAGNGGNPQARAVGFGSNALLTRASSLPSDFDTQELRRQEMFRSPRPLLNLKNSMVVKEKGNCSGDFDGNGLHVHPNGNPQRQEAARNPRARSSLIDEDVELIRNPTAEMPYVSTRGFGLANKPINGFLYRYGKGRDVKILCVCHGLFLSPAEFVRHGGGGDVEYPLKHIVVTTFPLDK